MAMRARVVIAGEGLKLARSGNRPAGVLRGGAFDPADNTIYLAGPGHPDGCAAAGGDPMAAFVAGISLFVRDDGVVFWANDSTSLPRMLRADEIAIVEEALHAAFAPHPVNRLSRISDVPLAS